MKYSKISLIALFFSAAMLAVSCEEKSTPEVIETPRNVVRTGWECTQYDTIEEVIEAEDEECEDSVVLHPFIIRGSIVFYNDTLGIATIQKTFEDLDTSFFDRVDFKYVYSRPMGVMTYGETIAEKKNIDYTIDVDTLYAAWEDENWTTKVYIRKR